MADLSRGQAAAGNLYLMARKIRMFNKDCMAVQKWAIQGVPDAQVTGSNHISFMKSMCGRTNVVSLPVVLYAKGNSCRLSLPRMHTSTWCSKVRRPSILRCRAIRSEEIDAGSRDWAGRDYAPDCPLFVGSCGRLCVIFLG